MSPWENGLNQMAKGKERKYYEASRSFLYCIAKTKEMVMCDYVASALAWTQVCNICTISRT